MPQPELHDELELLLRELRPAPDPGWANRLDARAARGFPAPPAFWRRPFIAARANLQPLGALAGVALVLAGGVWGMASLSGAGDDSAMPASARGTASSEVDSSANSAAATPSIEEYSRDSAGAETPTRAAKTAPPATAHGAPAGAPLASPMVAPDGAPTDPDAARIVAHTIALTLATRPSSVEDIADGVVRVTDSLGGYVQDSSVSVASGAASAELSLRIPQDKLQQGLTKLSRLAHVRRRTQQAEDLTDQRSALEAAVRDARADRDGLRLRLSRATTDKEATRLRGALQRAERRITARERSVAQVNRRAAMAVVDVSVVGDRKIGAAPPPKAGRWTPGDALEDAVRVLEVAAGVALITLAAALPIALLAFLVVVASRLFVRNRRERALEMA